MLELEEIDLPVCGRAGLRLAAHGRRTDDPGRVPAEDAPGDHGPCQHHHDAGLYGHLYPGEMDRYTDRLYEAAGDEAAGDADAAKCGQMRMMTLRARARKPLTWGDGGALGGTRTPNTHRSVDTCQPFSVVRTGPRAGMSAARLSASVRLAWEVVRPGGPSWAPGDRLRCCQPPLLPIA